MDQTQREFLVDIEELVEHVFSDLDELREKWNHGPSRRELIDRVFRRVHSVKGSAASAGLAALSHIAHEFENVLDAVRAGRTPLNEAVLDTFETATDALAESLSLAASGEDVESHQGVLLERLRATAKGKTRERSIETETLLKHISTEAGQSLTETQKQRLIAVIEEGNSVFDVATSFNVGNFDKQFSLLKEELTQHGEVISTSPTVNADHPGKVNFRILYASSESAQSLEASFADSDVTFQEVSNAQNLSLADNQKPDPTVESSLASVSARSNFVHTDLDKLDRLISSTHELFRRTSVALDFAISQTQNEARAKLRGSHDEIRSSFMGVEDDLINLRMVSMGPTLQRAARAGRAAARLARKEVDFDIGGADIQIDKLLAETIADPLIHLVRNAVDHGIETAEERAQAGKKKCGTVRIEAVSEYSQSRLRVTDDGRGIDPQLVGAAAKRLGIDAGASGLDLERSLRLIFRPGFTTLASASDVSGRGVGLDVVETAAEQVGGELRVSSKPGDGTTFEIRLPVTFGLLSATVVVSGNIRYCIPTSEAVAVDPIDKVSGTQLILVSMRELLGHPPAEQPDENGLLKQSKVITCPPPDEQAGTAGDGLKRIGLIVDAVEGTEEILVRNLGRHAGRWSGVAGATELRDGTVALVIDLPRLLSRR